MRVCGQLVPVFLIQAECRISVPPEKDVAGNVADSDQLDAVATHKSFSIDRLSTLSLRILRKLSSGGPL
jgi:hypothetical protein